MSSYLIDGLYVGMRLDQFLAERLIVYSRSQIQQAIQKGAATINGKKAKAHYALKLKDQLSFDESAVSEATPEKKREHKEPQEKPNIKQPTEKPKVLFEHQHYFILEKPAGWQMHRATNHDTAPLISDFVLELDPTLSIVGDKPELRPGIVHRLDREVSGLIVICRTQNFFDHIKQQFISRDVKKTYQALVFGHPAKDEDDIQFRIARSKRRARMAALPVQHPDGKTATTHFEVLERFQHTTLLALHIPTGRTNQIRVHLAAYDLPIVGDTVYGKRSPQNMQLGRVMLHSDYISFYDLAGERVEYTSPLPPAFLKLVEKGRSNMGPKKSGA